VAPAQKDAAVTTAYYSAADLQVRWGVSRSLVYKILQSDGFPRALKLGTSLRYLKSDIHEWEESSSGVS
jgi:predicted DNA-binding transcriptional regulator AlpA